MKTAIIQVICLNGDQYNVRTFQRTARRNRSFILLIHKTILRKLKNTHIWRWEQFMNDTKISVWMFII